jgi:hypothetical protein
LAWCDGTQMKVLGLNDIPLVSGEEDSGVNCYFDDIWFAEHSAGAQNVDDRLVVHVIRHDRKVKS